MMNQDICQKGGKKVLGVIPARLASTRLERKMLADICGKPLLYHTWNRVKEAKSLDALIIATDSKEIEEVARGFGATVYMTSDTLLSGSDRVAAAAQLFADFVPDIVVNIQGDEPLMPVEAIDAAVLGLIADTEAVVATPVTPTIEAEQLTSPNFVKAIADVRGYALYFSRSQIPYPRDPYDGYLKHLGLYVYRADFLQTYVTLAQTPLEKAEKLEQLRILENGYKIKLVKGDFRTLEVNTPDELEGVRKRMGHYGSHSS